MKACIHKIADSMANVKKVLTAPVERLCRMNGFNRSLPHVLLKWDGCDKLVTCEKDLSRAWDFWNHSSPSL